MQKLCCLLALLPVWVSGQSWFTANQNADLMISGVDFNATGGALQFNHPNGLATDGTKLLLCDRFHNRVLVWHTAPDAWNTLPDLVLGQSDFNANNPGDAKNELNWPGNVSLAANGKLAIADTNNDRILLWNTFPSANGQPADISINLTSISPPGIPQQWGWPWGVWTDGTRLAAVATSGAALLFWNTFPTSDNEAPDYTITHPHFGTPRNISTDGASFFFVGDHNAKVNGMPGTFFWNSYPLAANQPYDFYRDEWIKGTKLSSGQLIASGLSHIYTWNAIPISADDAPDETASPAYYDNGDGVDVVEANGKIYVCNYNGNNVLTYQTPPSAGAPDPVFAMGIADYHHNSLDSVGYIQNPAFSTDGSRLIVTSDFDKRIYIYNSLPATSGQMPDMVISTVGYDLPAWDNALYNNTFVAVGKNRLCVWNNATNLSINPSRNFNGGIGSAAFTDLKGVALDGHFLYVADRNGKVYIWNGIPANSTTNPLFTLDYGNVQLNRLSSDGEYFCVTQQSPAAVFIYRVADLLAGNTTPWKTIGGIGFLNLPSETITFGGALAIANMGFNNVLLWENIADAPNTANMVVLGQPDNTPGNPPAIGQNRLFMPGALLFENNRIWVGEHKFSSRILRFSQTVTGIENALDAEDWSLFPNPVGNSLFLKSENPDGNLVELFDATGRCLHQEAIFSNLWHLDTTTFPEGMYFVRYKNCVRKIVLAN
ncbi:MAG: T9SS type A sorting domain-containing protein [Saprospiraceae bacterium]|nr:T9SS type A sorting domain-containing protein [Saprospiraceae bacterium]